MSVTNAKEKLIAASYDLMLTRGYNSTTVDELCEAAQVSKGSFYHFFNTKEELGLALLDDYFAKAKKDFLSGPFLAKSDPLERMFAFLAHSEAAAPERWRQGCLLGNYATELSESHPMVRERLSEVLHGVTSGVAKFFGPIGEQYPGNKELTPDRVAELYIEIIEGGIVLSRAHDDSEYLMRGLRAFRHYVENLLR